MDIFTILFRLINTVIIVVLAGIFFTYLSNKGNLIFFLVSMGGVFVLIIVAKVIAHRRYQKSKKERKKRTQAILKQMKNHEV